MSDTESCFHCGQPVPTGSFYPVTIDDVSHDMCCPGCQAVAQAIVAGGLTDYYRYRTNNATTASQILPDFLQELEVYDQPNLQKSFVQADAEIKQAALILEGIVCAACVWLSERHIMKLPGVIEFSVNYATHRARIKWDDGQIHLSDILRAIASIGYIAHPFDTGRQEALYKSERAMALKRLAVAGLGAMQVMMFAVGLYLGVTEGMAADMERFFRWVSLLIATPVVLYSARPFFTSAWRDLKRRQLGMDVPVALAVGSAYVASLLATVLNTGEVYFDSVTMFTLFLLTGRFLEMGARHRAGQAAEELIKLLPAMATRLTETGEEVVAAMDLQAGDRILVKPGESIAADGYVVAGQSSVDESLLTGESLPLTKKSTDRLIAGSVNVESPLEFIVDKVGEQTVLASIQRLLDRAQSEKPHLAKVADRIASWFVGGLLLSVTMVGFWWWHYQPDEAFWVILSMLVVTCPCALSLATPAAMVASTGALTHLGVLTTRGHALETLARITHMIFDKTGTLTVGRLTLTSSQCLGAASKERCLAIAGALEQSSEHPIAKALLQVVSAMKLPKTTQVIATPGMGIEGMVDGRCYRVGKWEYVRDWIKTAPLTEDAADTSQIWLADESGALALFGFSDELRPDARQSLVELRASGVETIILSGDQDHVVQKLAAELGVTEARGDMTPADKLAYLEALQAQGAVVAMVGDGVNDAPVLAAAQVSLAMGQGTQLAQASADMILLAEPLRHIILARQTAKQTMRIVWQNFSWAILYNLIALPLAATGSIAPWMAAIGMSASSLVVVANALRLTQRPKNRTTR